MIYGVRETLFGEGENQIIIPNRTMIWDEWDNCKKMRKTAIKRLKRSGAEKSVLNHFTPDNELNELLMRMW